MQGYIIPLALTYSRHDSLPAPPLVLATSARDAIDKAFAGKQVPPNAKIIVAPLGAFEPWELTDEGKWQRQDQKAAKPDPLSTQN